MRIMHCLLNLLLAILIAILWLAITQQNNLLDSRRIPEARLDEVLEQSRSNGRRLAIVTRQNAVLTSRTQAILERIPPSVTPAGSFIPYRGPDEPLVLYEAEPVKAAGKKGKSQ